MIIKEEVNRAIEEFGDDAYKRFTDDKGFLFESNDELNRELVGWCDIKSKTLPELFSHGVEFYGFVQEVKMWEFKGIGSDWQDIPDHADYYGVLRGLKGGFYQHRRKTSAALKFDIERAKAGDVVECLYHRTKQVMPCALTDKLGSNPNGVAVCCDGELFIAKEYELRMKYPPRCNHEQ